MLTTKIKLKNSCAKKTTYTQTKIKQKKTSTISSTNKKQIINTQKRQKRPKIKQKNLVIRLFHPSNNYLQVLKIYKTIKLLYEIYVYPRESFSCNR